jgi:hypothetical protein
VQRVRWDPSAQAGSERFAPVSIKAVICHEALTVSCSMEELEALTKTTQRTYLCRV